LRTVARGLVFLAAAWLAFPAEAAEDDQDQFALEETPAAAPIPVYTSFIELGVGWNSENSFKFGDFTGLEERGPFVIGNFSIVHRDPYDSGGTEYLRFTGSDLGLTSRYLGVEYGHQGKFKVYFFFDQIPKFFIDDGRTPYIINPAGTFLTLPAGWVPSNRNISQLTQLNSSLHPVTISDQRTKFGGGAEVHVSRHLMFKTEFTHEKKEGDRTIAVIFGSSGGNPAGAVVPEPIDYETDNFKVALEFQGKKGQFILQYDLSHFRDNNDSMTFQNAFASTSWVAAASFPDGFGRLALPPDNQAHRVTLSGGYMLSPTTRAKVNLVYGRSTQNDMFLPYTVNPGIVVTTALPRTSLNGEVISTLANVGLTSRVTPKLTLDLDYRFENRNDNTPQDVFIGVPADSQNQEGIDDETARINLPYDRKQNLIKAKAAYRISSDVRVELAYSYEQLNRSFSEVGKTKENRVEGKLRLRSGEKLFGWVGIAYAVRTGNGYIDNALFLLSHTEEFFEEEPDATFENHPLIRKFFIADRDRFQVNGSINYMPSETVVLSIFGHLTQDSYDKTQLGLTDSNTYSTTFDASYNPSKAVTYHAFYTFESLDYMQSGLSHSNNVPANLIDFAGHGWIADTHDKVSTAGVGFDWQAIEDKVKVVFDFTYSNANTAIGLMAGTAITFLPLPDLKSRFYAADLRIDYRVRKGFLVRARYLYQRLTIADFALDGVNPDTMRFIIGLGDQSPSYNAHVIGFSGIFQF
jgi:MtrB/PioB family decaheme-associated outer membrane protein